EVPAALALDPAGRPVAVTTASDGTIVLVRFLENGGLDERYGSNGLVRTAMPPDSKVSNLLVDPLGRLIAIASNADGIVLLRYLPDGTLDPSFGVGGLFRTCAAMGMTVSAAFFDGAGRILVAAHGTSALAVARFEPDGTPSPGF